MRIFIGLCLIFSTSVFAADDESAPTPPNQNDVKVEKSAPKVGVTGVQTQSGGVHTGSGSLDPSQQSSMGLGIQIPFHKEKQAPADSDSKNKDDDSSK
jgi:hypothetical protein